MQGTVGRRSSKWFWLPLRDCTNVSQSLAGPGQTDYQALKPDKDRLAFKEAWAKRELEKKLKGFKRIDSWCKHKVTGSLSLVWTAYVVGKSNIQVPIPGQGLPEHVNKPTVKKK